MPSIRPILHALVVASLVSSSLAAQALIRVETSRAGMHRIAGEALERLIPLDALRPDRLTLTRDGRGVPLFIPGGADGRIDRGDEILFFADLPSDPGRKTATWILGEGANPARYTPGTLADDVPTQAEVRIRAPFGTIKAFESWATVDPAAGRVAELPRWGIAALTPASGKEDDASSSASWSIALDPRPIRAAVGTLSLRVAGALVPGVAQKLSVRVNGTSVGDITWNEPFVNDLELAIPGELLTRRILVDIRNTSAVPAVADRGNDLRAKRANRVVIAAASITYLTQVTGPSTRAEQTVVELPTPTEPVAMRRVSVTVRQPEGYIAFDPDAGKIFRKDEVAVRGDRPARLALIAAGGAYDPVELATIRPNPVRRGDAGADWIAITTDALKPQVEALAAHRRSRGHTTFVVGIRTLHDAYNRGAVGPQSIRAFLKDAHASWKTKPKTVLLAGDAQLDGDVTATRETLPTLLVPTAYNGWSAADPLLGDIDDDGFPDLAVGRIPARAPEDMSRVLDRILTSETRPETGTWKREALFVGIPAGFGAAQDAMIEKVAGDTLVDAVPPWIHLDATYASPASPWGWPIADFNGRFLRRYGAGALVVTYAGHGSERALDTLKSGKDRFPFMTFDDVGRLRPTRRTGAVVLLACSTGRHDDPANDCLAERWYLAEGGPLAMVAASRVSHPVPNALLGMALPRALTEPGRGVGEAWLATLSGGRAAMKSPVALLAAPFLSKSVTLDGLMRDHVALYHLFGDPAARLPLPTPASGLEAPERVRAGDPVSITFDLPEGDAWTASVAIERLRTDAVARARDAATAAIVDGDPDSRPNAATLATRHADANRVILASGSITVEPSSGGRPTIVLTVPADAAKGRCQVSLFLDSTLGSRVALRPLLVE